MLAPKRLNKNNVHIWGFLFSEKNHSIWKKVSENDWFFFYLNGKYSYACKVLNKVHNIKIANRLWHVNHSLDKMELIVIFKTVVKISLGFLKTNRLLGIESFIPSVHRITFVQANHNFVDELLRKHKSMESFIQILPFSRNSEQTYVTKIRPSDLKEPPPKFKSYTIRFIRDTKKSAATKKLYNDKCQICGYTISFDGQQYSEVHHVWPLGEGGIDDFDNMIVLCPNHHVEFDYAVIGFDHKDYRIIVDKNERPIGKIRFRKKHSLASPSVEYHNSRMQEV